MKSRFSVSSLMVLLMLGLMFAPALFGQEAAAVGEKAVEAVKEAAAAGVPQIYSVRSRSTR